MHKEDQVYIEHILDCIEKIIRFSEGVTYAEFSENELLQDGIIRNIEVIGEASKKVSQNLKQVYFHIPWKEMAGMRDKLIHDYFGIDLDVIWKTIQLDIPDLYIQIKSIVF